MGENVMGEKQARAYWFRARRLGRGRLPDSPWRFAQVFAATKREAEKGARQVLRTGLSKYSPLWGGAWEFEWIEKPDRKLLPAAVPLPVADATLFVEAAL
jgi:hypothetical protein